MSTTGLWIVGIGGAVLLVVHLFLWLLDLWDRFDAEIDCQRNEQDERDRLLGRPYTRRFWENL